MRKRDTSKNPILQGKNKKLSSLHIFISSPKLAVNIKNNYSSPKEK